MKKLTPWLILAAIIGGWVLFTSQCNQKKEKENAQQIITQLQDNPVEYYRNADSQIVAKVDAIEATEENIKPLLAGNKKLIKQVGKAPRVQSVLTAGYEANGQIKASVTDTVYHHETMVDTVRVFAFDDGYLYIYCTVGDDTATCPYSYQDSLQAVTYLEPMGKWFQFWKWGQKKAVTEVSFTNPLAKPVGVRSIVRRRR